MMAVRFKEGAGAVGRRVVRRGQAGFTLTQIVVTLAVMSIVMGFAVMRIAVARDQMRLANAAREFASYAEKARLDSIRRHGDDVTSKRSLVTIDSPTTYKVFMAHDYNDSGTATWRTFTLPSGVTFSSVAMRDDSGTITIVDTFPPGATFAFDWRGRTVTSDRVTFTNTRGLKTGKLIQNSFTFTKTAALLGLIILGVALGWNKGSAAFTSSWWNPIANGWSPQATPLPLQMTGPLALLLLVGYAMVGPLFAQSAWNNVTFTGSEIRDPGRNLPRALLIGCGAVVLLYLLANVAYVVTLPLAKIQNPQHKVATDTMQAIFGQPGMTLMAIAIMISTGMRSGPTKKPLGRSSKSHDS